MNYTANPDNFNPRHQAAGCIIERDRKFVLLKGKTEASPTGYFWSIPAGKLEEGETPQEALRREIYEETGIKLKVFEKIRVFNIRLNRIGGYDFTYHLYRTSVSRDTEVKLSREHEDHKWVDKEEALTMDLEHGAELYLAFI